MDMKRGADREGSSRYRFRLIFENLDLNFPAAIRRRIFARGVRFLALIRFEKTKTGTGTAYGASPRFRIGNETPQHVTVHGYLSVSLDPRPMRLPCDSRNKTRPQFA